MDKLDPSIALVQVNNYEIVVNFFDISLNLTSNLPEFTSIILSVYNLNKMSKFW
jgi:hypothetical protein